MSYDQVASAEVPAQLPSELAYQEPDLDQEPAQVLDLEADQEQDLEQDLEPDLEPDLGQEPAQELDQEQDLEQAQEPDLVQALEPEPEPGTDQGLDEDALRAALEAILLVVDEPVGEAVLADVLEQPAQRVADLLTALSAEYTTAGRGFDLRRAAGGWRLYTRAEQAAYVQRYVLDGQQARLTQAALETLAVVAYRQPVTRSRVSAIRGVNCDGVIRTLLTRGLVEEIGTEPETGAYLYRTTTTFLEKLGLDSLDELPPLAPFLPEDVDEFDPDAPEDTAEPSHAPG